MLTAATKTKALGSVKYGQDYHFQFLVKNEGPSHLKITKLVVSCGACTKASINSDILAPGEQGQIDVVFTPGSTGIQNKFVDVYYTINAEEMPAFRLSFNATSHG